MRWAEISDYHERERMMALSEAIKAAGVENEVHFIEAEAGSMASVLRDTMKDYDQIRIGGDICIHSLEHFAQIPIGAKQVGFADAIVYSEDQWWPRNFMAEGIHRAVVTDAKTINIGSGVFILGATCAARAAVAAFSRAGLQRFTISDPDEDRGEAFVETLRRTYFQVQFQFVPRHMITQLPSVHSVGVNTLVQGRDQGALEELLYFNFLEPGGLWIDMPIYPGSNALTEEASAAGAFVETGLQVAVYTDWLWAQSCGLEIDRVNYTKLLQSKLPRQTAAPESKTST